MYKSEIGSVIISVLLTFIVNVAVPYFSMDKGYVVFGEPFIEETRSLQPIEVVNHSDSTLSSLLFVVPKELDLKKVLITKPLIIKELVDTVSPLGQKLIELSGVAPNSTARLLIPIVSETSSCCELINNDELKVGIKRDTEVVNPMNEILIEATIFTFIYSVIFISGFYWLSRQLKGYISENKELHDRVKRLSDEFDDKYKENQKYVVDLRLIYKRQRYMLLRRIKDYAAEIEFWRTAIRRQLLTTMKPEDVEKKLLVVSEKLNTRSTHGNILREYDEFHDSIQLAEEVSEKVT